jgi:hypothetical protein
MSELVGTTFPLQVICFPEATKRAALMFSKIVIVNLVETLDKIYEYNLTPFKDSADEILDLVFKHRVLVSACIEPLDVPVPMPPEGPALLEELKFLEEESKSVHETDTVSSLTLHLAESELGARVTALSLRRQGRDAYPFCSVPFTVPPQFGGIKTHVINIMLEALPLPDESVSWEQILEYRADPDSYSKFLALRNWMNDISQTRLSAVEIEQKLEYLLDEYQQHMRLHRMKTKLGTLETLITTTAEFLEDFANKRFSKVAKALFKTKHQQIELLEAELSAPGKEVSYLIATNNKFKPSDVFR